MYTVEDYARMGADPARTEAYLRALEATVRPGDVVLEIGTGIGLFAIAAARLGARRVHAVELNESVCFARELAHSAGVEDRISFFHGSVWDLPVSEPADVIFFDLRGASPLYGDALRTAAGMIERWLRPNGSFFPKRDRLFASLVEAPWLHEKVDRLAACGARFGLGEEPLRTILTSALMSDSNATPVLQDHVLTEPWLWTEIAYGAPPATSVRGDARLTLRRPGVANGVALWFSAELLDGIVYDSAPGTRGVYARIILPLERPVAIEEGDAVKLSLMTFATGSDWAWNVYVADRSGAVRHRSHQSSIRGRPMSTEALVRTTPDSRPTLSSSGQRMAQLLSAMDGAHTLDELAQSFAPHPRTQNELAHTLGELRDLAARYGA